MRNLFLDSIQYTELKEKSVLPEYSLDLAQTIKIRLRAEIQNKTNNPICMHSISKTVEKCFQVSHCPNNNDS